jgi:hypothetical protein
MPVITTNIRIFIAIRDQIIAGGINDPSDTVPLLLPVSFDLVGHLQVDNNHVVGVQIKKEYVGTAVKLSSGYSILYR